MSAASKQSDGVVVVGGAGWISLFRAAGAGALLSVGLMVLDIGLSFSGGDLEVGALAAADWLRYLQEHWFLGLRNLGFFNVVNLVLTAPLYLALYRLHRRSHPAGASLALLLFVLGAAVYISNNRALAMLSLSEKYAVATSPSVITQIETAGSVLLVQAEDFTPGSFMGFFLSSTASLVVMWTMAKGSAFRRWIGVVGAIGTGCLFVFTVCATFFPASFNLVMALAVFGGLLMLVWNVATAMRLFHFPLTALQEPFN